MSTCPLADELKDVRRDLVRETEILEVAVRHRLEKRYLACRTPRQTQCRRAECDQRAVAEVHRRDRRLVYENVTAPVCNERAGRAEIDGNLAAHGSLPCFLKTGSTP